MNLDKSNKTNPVALSSLLGGALNRAKLRDQVDIYSQMKAVTDFLKKNLPRNSVNDAKAISIKNGILTIGCKSGAAAYFVSRKEKEMFDILRSEQAKVNRIQTKILDEFPSAEINNQL